ncbi:sigma-70 family RNA polymerase sigma factor [Pyrinomonas sp.]|uniref:sigma-70 family RNA polymerase sigma factor n=1 Tax=Pyrinomonas sp. TaxID=2080306 RepID=UPI003326C356
MQDQSSSLAVDRDALIKKYQQYARSLASKIIQTLPPQIEVDIEEIYSYSDLGLVEAASRYDPRRGVSFTTFAYYRIKGAIYDGLRQLGVTVRLRDHDRVWADNLNDLLQAAADDEQMTTERAAASIEDEINEVRSLIEDLIPAYLLSVYSPKVAAMVQSPTSPAEEAEQRELIEIIVGAIAELPAKERQVIESVYLKSEPMMRVAERMGVNKSWVTRIHARAIRRLRDALQQRGVLGEEPEEDSSS